MTRDEIRATVLRILGEIAPETDMARIEPHADLREQIDLDSMDVLNFMVALHDALHVEIPEVDYPKLTTLNACVDYLHASTSSLPGGAPARVSEGGTA